MKNLAKVLFISGLLCAGNASAMGPLLRGASRGASRSLGGRLRQFSSQQGPKGLYTLGKLEESLAAQDRQLDKHFRHIKIWNALAKVWLASVALRIGEDAGLVKVELGPKGKAIAEKTRQHLFEKLQKKQDTENT